MHEHRPLLIGTGLGVVGIICLVIANSISIHAASIIAVVIVVFGIAWVCNCLFGDR